MENSILNEDFDSLTEFNYEFKSNQKESDESVAKERFETMLADQISKTDQMTQDESELLYLE